MRSRWRQTRVIVVAAAPTLLVACSASDGPCGDEDCHSIARGIECESFGCGGNASIADTMFHELRVGQPNEEGLVIVSFTSGQGAAPRLPVGTPMVPEVRGNTLVGLVPDQPAVEGAELQGATMRLLRPSGRGVFARIKSTAATEFWVTAEAGPAQATVYEFEWLFEILLPGMPPLPLGPGMPLCDGLPGEDEIEDPHPTIASDAVQPSRPAFVFAGDRYDSHGITVEVPGEPGWFNIACVRTALAKMHLLRYTTAGSGSTGSPSTEQRQAMLKLLSADYCGDGRAYARNGTPLFIQDQDGRFDPTPWLGDRIAESEAIWTASGALCLDDPRRWDPAQSVADLRAEIVAACENSPVESLRRTIPHCTEDQLASWQSFGHISRNVDPP
jgi:hypothetical protein